MYCGHARLCVCVSVCLSVCVSVLGRTPILLHGPGCNLGVWQRLPPSCALQWWRSGNIARMQNVSEYMLLSCTRSMPGLLITCGEIHVYSWANNYNNNNLHISVHFFCVISHSIVSLCYKLLW